MRILLHACASILIANTRAALHDWSFMQRHRANQKSFIRKRLLTFPRVCLLLLQKTVRSAQCHLNDFFKELDSGQTSASASAWTQARAKFKHTAFIELNEQVLLPAVYDPLNDFKPDYWRGLRLLAIDSSVIRLPAEEAVGEEFGWQESSNGTDYQGRYVQGRLSVLYDVLNRIALHTSFGLIAQGEREVAYEHLARMEPADVAVLDRGYASYELFARFLQASRHFVCRCSKSSFKDAQQMFALNQAGASRVVTMKRPAPKDQQEREAFKGLPEMIKVRLITVRLPGGELEVLATSLLDEKAYPTEEFSALYHARWGIETYYGTIKGRLGLEHFSGKTVEAIKQDVHATVFLSNLETVVTREAKATLQERSKDLKHRQQVNRADSFHAIKSRIIELLLSNTPIEEVLAELNEAFLKEGQPIRPGRSNPRTRSPRRTAEYQRNVRKHVF